MEIRILDGRECYLLKIGPQHIYFKGEKPIACRLKISVGRNIHTLVCFTNSTANPYDLPCSVFGSIRFDLSELEEEVSTWVHKEQVFFDSLFGGDIPLRLCEYTAATNFFKLRVDGHLLWFIKADEVYKCRVTEWRDGGINRARNPFLPTFMRNLIPSRPEVFRTRPYFDNLIPSTIEIPTTPTFQNPCREIERPLSSTETAEV